MILSSLQIKNLRGIEDVSINLKDFTTLIGQNNSGKSSILRAIQLFCNGLSPDFEEFRNSQTDLPIESIGVFEDLQNWERKTSIIFFKKQPQNNGVKHFSQSI